MISWGRCKNKIGVLSQTASILTHYVKGGNIQQRALDDISDPLQMERDKTEPTHQAQFELLHQINTFSQMFRLRICSSRDMIDNFIRDHDSQSAFVLAADGTSAA